AQDDLTGQLYEQIVHAQLRRQESISNNALVSRVFVTVRKVFTKRSIESYPASNLVIGCITVPFCVSSATLSPLAPLFGIQSLQCTREIKLAMV
ncbi:hypothetical protein, partial [Pseudomonas viridiflava]|uniref:hypothetical protein n=1 Tax=Pseudomonas viridiflava TaxID=33069 RepID=UPI0019D06F34